MSVYDRHPRKTRTGGCSSCPPKAPAWAYLRAYRTILEWGSQKFLDGNLLKIGRASLISRVRDFMCGRNNSRPYRPDRGPSVRIAASPRPRSAGPAASRIASPLGRLRGCGVRMRRYGLRTRRRTPALRSRRKANACALVFHATPIADSDAKLAHVLVALRRCPPSPSRCAETSSHQIGGFTL